MKAILPLKYLTTADAASAIDSKNASCSGKLFHKVYWSVFVPAECIKVLPADDAHPIDNCFNAPPYPPIGCPLKCDKTSIES